VQDGEQHAAQDKLIRELVEHRNQADQLIHTVQTSMTNLAKDLTDVQKTQLKTLIEQLKMAVNGDDKATIEMRKKALQEAYSKIKEAEQSQHTARQQDKAANDSAKDKDIIDADFEDVSNG
jgi:molecular chaperone DnaK